jgi:hypothetical protein
MHNTIISLRSRPVLLFFLRTHQESRDDAVRWRSDKWHWQLETRSAFTRLAHLHEMGTGVEKVRVRQRRVPRPYFSRGAHHVTQFITGYFASQSTVHQETSKIGRVLICQKTKRTHDDVCVEKSSRRGTRRTNTARRAWALFDAVFNLHCLGGCARAMIKMTPGPIRKQSYAYNGRALYCTVLTKSQPGLH